MLECAKSGYVIDSTEYQQLTNGASSLHQDSSDGDDQDFSRRSKKMKTSYQA